MSRNRKPALRGRGAETNPRNRFERFEVVPTGEDHAASTTEFYTDNTRAIITSNASPDVGFEKSVNPYRGCEHGCIYCYARPTHEYLGFSAGLDFETKIIVKRDAASLLRRQLSARRWVPQAIALSGNTDPYQPIESELKITRECLEVLADFMNPVVVITKNHLVVRDSDVLERLAARRAAKVLISITTLDRKLARTMEPRTASPKRRLAAIEALVKCGVPTGVLVAPVIPGLTDHEMPAIVAAAARAGATFAGRILVRLPHGVAPLFSGWLEAHFPDRKAKIINRIREVRGGQLSDPRFGYRQSGTGPYAEQMTAMFRMACKRAGLDLRGPELSTDSFRRFDSNQMPLL